MTRRILIYLFFVFAAVLLSITAHRWISHHGKMEAGSRQLKQLETQLAKDRNRGSAEVKQTLELEIQGLRSQVQSFREQWLSAEQLHQRERSWAAFWTVSVGGVQESHRYIRRVYQLALSERNIAEWAAIAREIDAVSTQVGGRLTDLAVEAEGDANQRRLRRVELTVVVFERKPEEDKRG